MGRPVNRDLAAGLMFGTCTLIWGTTWLAIKEGYGGLDPLWAASLRFFAASLLLFGILLVTRASWRAQWQDAAVVVFVGIVMFGADYGLIYWGEQFLPSGLAAILFATMPLFVGLFGAWLIPAERWTTAHASGVILGLVGLVAIFRDQLVVDAGDLWPMVAIVLAAAAAGVSSVVIRRWGHEISPELLNAGAMFVGAGILFVASLAAGETPAPPQGAAAWWSVTYLAVFGSVVAFLLYLRLLKVWTANRASLIALSMPVVAVLAGVVVLGERLTPLQILGAALVLGGVALSLLAPMRARVAAPEGAVGEGDEKG